nr:glycosyltransferase [Candidatus Krumholzibacteria bacterium]
MSRTVSLCMIVKDEAARLPGALASVRHLVDEMVVCDTGSGDNTVTIAAEYGARVVTFDW